MKRYLISIAVLLIVASVAACSTPPATVSPTEEPDATEAPTVSHGGPVEDYVSLIDALRAAGATVEPAGEVEQPFFSVTGQAIKVNGSDVQVFEFEDEAEAQSAAGVVGPDGSNFGTMIVDWVAPPHFYRVGKLIVLYVGDDATTTELLDNTLGAQFAGSQ